MGALRVCSMPRKTPNPKLKPQAADKPCESVTQGAAAGVRQGPRDQGLVTTDLPRKTFIEGCISQQHRGAGRTHTHTDKRQKKGETHTPPAAAAPKNQVLRTTGANWQRQPGDGLPPFCWLLLHLGAAAHSVSVPPLLLSSTLMLAAVQLANAAGTVCCCLQPPLLLPEQHSLPPSLLPPLLPLLLPVSAAATAAAFADTQQQPL
jgi:hypothetical protein